MSKKNIIRLTESDLKRVISESVKRILSEGIASKHFDLDAYVMFDPEAGDVEYVNSLFNSPNANVREAAKFMDKLTSTIFCDKLQPFKIWINTNGYIEDWIDPHVYVMDWPDEVENAPEEIKKTILELVKCYVEENKHYWDVSDDEWVWDTPDY